MTTADAARLLIATAMSDLVLQSVETIQMADSLRSGIPELSGKEHYFLDHNPGRPSSGALFANSCRRLLFTTFGEAVKNLIEAAGQTNPLLLEVYTDSGQPYEIMHPGILVLAKMVPEKGKRVIRSANIVLGYGSEFEIKADYVIPKSMRLRRHDVHSHLKRTEELDEFPIMKLGSALISAVSETPG
ncbi:MAG: hypothetical protein WDN02_16830 [Methylovirgula sp.]|uniref:hypothetical protein n=1 Tax=Methylovirgula sp. TaxID=1978224 RepID=UPI00307662F6